MNEPVVTGNVVVWLRSMSDKELVEAKVKNSSHKNLVGAIDSILDGRASGKEVRTPQPRSTLGGF